MNGRRSGPPLSSPDGDKMSPRQDVVTQSKDQLPRKGKQRQMPSSSFGLQDCTHPSDVGTTGCSASSTKLSRSSSPSCCGDSQTSSKPVSQDITTSTRLTRSTPKRAVEVDACHDKTQSPPSHVKSLNSEASSSRQAAVRPTGRPPHTPNHSSMQRIKDQTHSRSKLARPFKSPLLRIKPSQDANAETSPSSHRSSKRGARISSSPSKPMPLQKSRSERDQLEARLILLKQADKCLREKSLETLPQLISKWKEAGRMAAQDLWTVSGASEIGAEASFQPGNSFGASRGDYGLESHPDSVSPSGHRLKRAKRSCSPPASASRRRAGSAGSQQMAADLYYSGDDGIGHDDEDSGESLPPITDLFKEAKSRPTFGLRQQGPKIPLKASEDDAGINEYEEKGKGLEYKWNIGRMLDLVGADKSSLGWNPSEEDFQD